MSEEKRTSFAAIDLGSNSFHMVIAREDAGQLHVIDRMREPVMLGSGLDERDNLSPATRARALEALSRFAQRLRGLSPENVRAVGTKTLRRAQNAATFLKEAESVLGHGIDIITGAEEARLVYHGVRASGEMPEPAPHLVLDIGGASTEIAIGSGPQPDITESFSAGCVIATNAYFSDGVITADSWQRAVTSALVELHPLQSMLRDIRWNSVVGCSGSIKSIAAYTRQHVQRDRTLLKVDALSRVRDDLLEAGSMRDPRFDCLSDSRRKVFAGGVAVLYALFSAFEIHAMWVSSAALREGVLHEIYGRTDEDVQRRTVTGLQRRFGVDLDQADRVCETVSWLIDQVRAAWLFPARLERVARQAAQLHEIGLAVSHSQYHKHGEMLLTHVDLPGFSRRQQLQLATLVRLQRKRFQPKLIPTALEKNARSLLRIAMLLRISLILCRDRHRPDLELLGLNVELDALTLTAPSRWLEQNPLTHDELMREGSTSSSAGFALHLLTD